ncbi:MAG: penicillin-binding protein 2 [Trichodesmium sp. St16_bin4-tuft]|nr:penicillin-binding protein 2 [Trichodesmium sp. MAG_R01]MDE5068813.1 penicillin-binding protein 2 [Trichodesmium sp. St4_bin8_1]MDE5071053.1 penicillin-binding protein 2 [Trichodesmium sp. St5_bin8]MDE5092673.1 penicillin-binding protein 2 [Trichodesmium sp. St18_bin3_1_1]MDE5099468.1 penicillin-binding protein 2 [Trichodesmium sp. St16_bin4-tuft]MDE5101604.1 penicillin-binding protein 2 [Trichodesmium sp. St19_bin2]
MVREFSFSSWFRKTEENNLPDQERQSPLIFRTIVIVLLTTTTIGLQVTRLAQIQLIQGKQNRERAENNRIRPIPVPSNRGLILDRNGKAFASNRLKHAIYLWPKEQPLQQWKITAAKLSPIINIPADKIIKKVEQAITSGERNIHLSDQVSRNTFITLQEKTGEFPGVEVRPESTRYYPYGQLASHVIGYLGEVTPAELEANPEYQLRMMVGRIGVEASANDVLAGKWGQDLIEVNAHNREVRIFEEEEKEAKSGKTVKLTLDINLQKAAETALGFRKGAVVVLDVNTGEVLAMASYPRFNPNVFTKPMPEEKWRSLHSEEQSFLNRSLQGYPPGSTFKIVTAAAALGSGKFSPYSIIQTSDSIYVGGILFNEHSGGYGAIGFRTALAYSSNTFFYHTGMTIGHEQIAQWAYKLGLGGKKLNLLGIPSAYNGLIPTEEDKRRIYNDAWYLGDTITMAIGQGLVLVTPLELATATATIANSGKQVTPHLFAHETNSPEMKPIPIGLKPEYVNTIKKGMIDVVEYGTAQLLNDGTIPLTGGKTGTSEVMGQKSHSLYVGFGPAEESKIAIAVIVENGGYGSFSAAPVAKKVFQTYFSKYSQAKLN